MSRQKKFVKESKRDKVWKYNYIVVEQYFIDNGNLAIKSRYVCPDGFRLGYWIKQQRKNYFKNILSEDKVFLLEKIGMVWSVPDSEWQYGYNKALDYYHTFGNLDVPVNYKCNDDYPLGKWIQWKRSAYVEGTIKKEHKDALDEIDMVWSMMDEKWDRQYQNAKNFYDTHNHLVIPEIPENSKLIGWIRHQRNLYKEHKLPQDKIALLESIGMVWEVKKSIWETGFHHLQDYYSVYGNVNVKYNYIASDGFRLGAWVSRQRYNYSKDKLSSERVKRLNALGMQWKQR